MFCATARSGLGHVRRVANIASALKGCDPSLKLTLITNAPIAGLQEDEIGNFGEIVIAGRKEMARRIALLDADLVVVDTAIVPDIALLPVPLCLILRETVPDKLARFRLPAGRLWDAVIVPAPEREWRPDEDQIGARNVINVGWIFRLPSVDASDLVLGERSSRPRVLVAAGGGGNDATIEAFTENVSPVLSELRRSLGEPIDIVQALGPRTPPAMRLAVADRYVDPGPRLNDAFREADLVVTTAGYNSILELAVTDTPAVLVAITRTYDDQSARAKRWQAELGVAHNETEAGRTVDFMARTLRSGTRRTPLELEPSGMANCARAVIKLARAQPVVGPGGIFRKATKPDAPVAERIAARSQALFAAGVKTLPARRTSQSELSFARISGQTAREQFRSLGRIASADALCDRLDWFDGVARALVNLHAKGSRKLRDLRPFDAWHKVRPRLGKPYISDDHGQRLSVAVRDLIGLGEHSCAAQGRNLLLHGDFHCGQIILPNGYEGVCLIDLDDLALGPPEADIANFAAHLATSSDLYAGSPADGFAAAAAVLASQYAALSGKPVDRTLINWHGAAALTRRFLKLCEQGRDRAMAEAHLAAIELIVQDVERLIGSPVQAISPHEPVQRVMLS